MEKTLLITLAVFMALGLSACGSATEEAIDPVTPDQPKEETQDISDLNLENAKYELELVE